MGCSASKMDEMKTKAKAVGMAAAAKAKSAANEVAAANGIQFVVPGEQGSFAPFSNASFACLDVVVGKEKAEGMALGSLEAEFDDNMRVRCPTSTKVRDGWGIKREDKSAIRVKYEADDMKLTKMKHNLDGLDIALGPKNNLDVMLCTYMPLNAPVGLYKDGAKIDANPNKSKAKPIVIQPDVRLVDLYMTVDGKTYEDNKFCCGEGHLNSEAAMKEAKEKSYDQWEEPMQIQTKRGPPSGTKPWVTLFAKDAFRAENFIYLPLMIPEGADIDTVMVDEVKSYAEGLLAAWAKLCKDIGPGKHTFELRISPRGIIHPAEGQGQGYKMANALIEGYGKVSEINTNGSPSAVFCEGLDKKFIAFCKEHFEGKDLVPDADNPIFNAKFTLDLDKAVCTGAGPERVASKFADLFNDDLAEHCQIALDLAGAASGPARQAFGQSPGKPVHIVIPERKDFMAGGIFDSTDDKKGDEYRHFIAIAFWLHPDTTNDEAEGCSELMYLKKYTRRNWQTVGSPAFEVVTPGSEWGVRSHAQRIKNKQIRKAIERDASIWNAKSELARSKSWLG